MKTGIKVNSAIMLVAAIVAFFWLLFILFQVNTDLPEALNIDKSQADIRDYLLGLGHLFVLFFNLYAIIVILSHFRHYHELRLLKTILLILGIISLLAIGAEKVMVDEIARQYRLGMSVSEVVILNISYIINMTFTVSVFYFILKTLPMMKAEISGKGSVDETIFTIAQYMGILSGTLGLLLVFDLSGKEIVKGKLIFYIPFFILFVTPYGLAVLYWLFFKSKHKLSDWYDEKQLHDIMKASLTTLVISIPGLAVFLFLGISSSLYFFLYYVFLVLLLFSAGTLFYYKR